MNTAEFLRSNARWLSAGALLTFLSCFGQTFFISLFAGEIQRTFDLSSGDWGLIYAFGTLASAAVMVWAGSLTDSFRTRHLGIAVLVGLAASCLLMATNSFVSVLVVSIFLLRLFGQGMASHTAIVAMSRWFVATRGRALAVCALGFTIGESLFPILFVSLLDLINWRLLWVVAALIALAGIPLLAVLLRTERHPRQVAEETQSFGMDGRHWNRIEVLRHPLFWFMIPALLGPSAFNTAFFFHHVHFAELKGWSHIALVAFFPVYTVSAVGAMIASGRALDALGTARLLPFYQLPLVVAFVAFSYATGFTGLVLGLFFLALTSGANSTLPNAFWAEFYGTKHLGSIKSMATAIMVLGSAIGPGVTGFFIDRGVLLETQFLFVAGFFVLTTVFMWLGIRLYRDRRKYT